MMLIESEPPSEKQLLKANSISTKLIANSNSPADNLTAANYRHLQLYSQSLGEKKMNSISQYQLSNSVNGTAFLGGQTNAATLNRLSTLNAGLNQNGLLNVGLSQNFQNHGTIRPHNQTLTTQLNGGLNGLTPLQNNIISNYATISRAAHNQLNGGGLLSSQVPNSQPHLAHLNSHQIYQQLAPLSSQMNQLGHYQLANGIYAPAQFVGLEVGLDLDARNRSCCFCCSRRCNISRVSSRLQDESRDWSRFNSKNSSHSSKALACTSGRSSDSYDSSGSESSNSFAEACDEFSMNDHP